MSKSFVWWQVEISEMFALMSVEKLESKETPEYKRQYFPDRVIVTVLDRSERSAVKKAVSHVWISTWGEDEKWYEG